MLDAADAGSPAPPRAGPRAGEAPCGSGAPVVSAHWRSARLGRGAAREAPSGPLRRGEGGKGSDCSGPLRRGEATRRQMVREGGRRAGPRVRTSLLSTRGRLASHRPLQHGMPPLPQPCPSPSALPSCSLCPLPLSLLFLLSPPSLLLAHIHAHTHVPPCAPRGGRRPPPFLPFLVAANTRPVFLLASHGAARRGATPTPAISLKQRRGGDAQGCRPNSQVGGHGRAPRRSQIGAPPGRGCHTCVHACTAAGAGSSRSGKHGRRVDLERRPLALAIGWEG